MKKAAATTALALWLFLPVISTTDVGKVRKDEFTGEVVTSLKGPGLLIGSGFGLVTGRMQIKKIESDGQTAYFLVFSLSSSDWLFIDAGETLILLVKDSPKSDPERVKLAGGRSKRDVVSGGKVSEIVSYRVSPEQLQRLAAASEIRYTIRGSKGSVKATIKPKQRQKIALWVAQYVEP